MPWCVLKCPYCDFNSHVLRGELPEKNYIRALLSELNQLLPDIQGRPLSSVFIGGGTPSLFSAEAYCQLFDGLKEKLIWKEDLEVTLEANPNSVEQQRFQAYHQLGICRLSIGIQSFNDASLKNLGRAHNASEAIQAVSSAKNAGFKNFNLDLMYGLPQQNVENALNDLRKAIDCKPTHLSWYQLTLEPDTYFYKHPPSLPTDDRIWAMQEAGKELLASEGFQQYEISAYSKVDYACQHNLNYWEFGDYLGLGAGAHSKLTHSTGQVVRHWNVKAPKDYMDLNTPFIADKKEVPQSEIAFEFMMNTLRLKKPLLLSFLKERAGLTPRMIQKPLDLALSQGFLIMDEQAITVTPLGYRFLNNLLELFL